MDRPRDDGRSYPDPAIRAAGDDGTLFTDIDVHFARLMEKMASAAGGGVWEASALVSSFTRQGHTCMDLAPFAGLTLEGGIVLPELDEWRSALMSSGVVGSPGEYRPMVLDRSSKLYLWRYWSYQQVLSDTLLALARREAAIDAEEVRREVPGLFPRPAGDDGIDWQKVAVLIALKSGLSIITGGPGTGKTTVVTKILALLGKGGRGLKVALAAPTGKAAQRMEEAVRKTGAELGASGGAPERDLRASTLHRLLGIFPGRAQARFSKTNPLPYDVVVVDEASMISLALMTRLVLALKPAARLILVGDRNQLASVEPGHVLGDICGPASEPCYSPKTCGLIRSVLGYELPPGNPRGVQDSLVELRTAHRFRRDSGIRALSEAVRAGDAGTCLGLIRSGGMSDVLILDPGGPTPFVKTLEKAVLEGYAPCLGEKDIAERFRLFSGFRILCALREGPHGVAAINGLVERILKDRGLIRPTALHYHGRPVLVTANDYTLNLFNGDIGMVLRDEDGGLACWFQGPGMSLRKISVTRLPEHETAYAMTVHKSQGSEFSRVMLVLPLKDSPVLTRELVYTGITRAMNLLELWTTPEILSLAVGRRTERISGLGDLLAVSPEETTS